MPSDFERNLDKYAEVIVKVGLNLQPGQRLLIGRPGAGSYGTPIELAPLVRRIVKVAYQSGARLVEVLWEDDALHLLRFQHAPPGTMEEFPAWRAAAAIQSAQAGDAVLRLSALNPGLLVDQDPDLVSLFNSTMSRHMAPFSEVLTRSGTNWSVAVAAVDGWARTLFPELPPAEAKARLWDVMFDICRINRPDPLTAWKEHISQLLSRIGYLNGKRYAGLRLRGPGTDLTLGLPEGHIWGGARMPSQTGIDFTANIPTEEVFTSPHAAQTEGFVTMTKPLSYGGVVVEGLRMAFSGGRMTELTASKGAEYLQTVLSVDGGAQRLGEIALVPHSSPISQSGMLFYNILIDENAASHIALGRSFRFALAGAAAMSDEEFDAAGGNGSLVHIDCMVGSGQLDVDGLASDGSAEPVMRAGEWAFEV